MAAGMSRVGAAEIAVTLSRLARVWNMPKLSRLPTALHPRLKRTLGRVVLRPLAIQLNRNVLASSRRPEVIAHEAAHAALVLTGKASSTRPHGPEWQHLMALAGFPKARATSQRPCMPRPKTHQPKASYDHHCPVCQTSRTAKRPVPEWRCAECVAAGLPGRLEIQQRPTARA